MTKNGSSTQTNSVIRPIGALALLASLLLLTGCSLAAVSDFTPQSTAANWPAPSIQPARFSDIFAPATLVRDGFDERTYVPDRIVIPSIELDTPVVTQGWSTTTGNVFGNWDVASYAAGWHVNSDLLGQGGNVVFSGHNNVLGAVFRKLDQLKEGDVATVWSGNKRFDYEIESVIIVPERDATREQRLNNATWIGQFDDNRVTLVSCWPRDDNSHRIIAVGHFVGPQQGSSTTRRK